MSNSPLYGEVRESLHSLSYFSKIWPLKLNINIFWSNKSDVHVESWLVVLQPVNMYPANELGYHDVFGNAWEWAEDHFNGLNGYSSHWYYDDFSSPCFDGRHNLILVSTGKYMYLVLFKMSKGFQEICEVAMVLLPMPYFPLVFITRFCCFVSNRNYQFIC